MKALIETKRKLLKKVLSALESAIYAMEQGGPPEGGRTDAAIKECKAAAKAIQAKLSE